MSGASVPLVGTPRLWVVPLCAALLLCTSLVAWSQTLAAEAPSIVDTRDHYRIGFLRFESDSLSPELEYLLISLPELFIREFQRVRSHFYDDDERAAYQQYLSREYREQIAEQLTGLLVTRDEEALSGTDPSPDQDERIAIEQERLQVATAYDTALIAVAASKPIEIVNMLDTYPERTPSYRAIAQAQNVDMIFDGFIEQRDEFVLLTVRYYQRATNQIDHFDSVSVGQDEIDMLAPLVNDRIADVIVGVPWSTIAVAQVRDQDAVYIDDILIGYGVQTARYLPLGAHTVRVESEYFTAARVQEVMLDTAEPIIVRFTDDRPEPSFVTIETTPPGATIYVNSTWQGETPLALERLPVARTLLLRKSGYFDVKRVLNDDTADLLRYTLTPELFDQGAWLFSRRDRFYAALTAFILSVPVPIVLNGIYENNAAYQRTTGYQTLTAAAQSAIDTTATVSRVGTYTTIFVSVALAVNAIIEAVHYVRAADFFHRL